MFIIMILWSYELSSMSIMFGCNFGDIRLLGRENRFHKVRIKLLIYNNLIIDRR